LDGVLAVGQLSRPFGFTGWRHSDILDDNDYYQNPQRLLFMRVNQGRRDQRSLWDKIWRDRRGRIVLWQTPNPWLIGWLVLTFISLLFTGRRADIFSWLGSVSLIVWSLLEVFKGVNYFRRALGLLVLVMSVMSFIHNL
jgi:hypothetical protein